MIEKSNNDSINYSNKKEFNINTPRNNQHIPVTTSPKKRQQSWRSSSLGRRYRKNYIHKNIQSHLTIFDDSVSDNKTKRQETNNFRHKQQSTVLVELSESSISTLRGRISRRTVDTIDDNENIIGNVMMNEVVTEHGCLTFDQIILIETDDTPLNSIVVTNSGMRSEGATQHQPLTSLVPGPGVRSKDVTQHQPST